MSLDISTLALDRPIWSALTQNQAMLAEIDGPARRYPEDMARFAATADLSPASIAALAKLIPPHGAVALFEVADVPPPPDLAVMRRATVLQMVAGGMEVASGPDFALLGDDDAADMAALVARTNPGPFAARTHHLGRYLGLRQGGSMVAMAGERMKLAGFTEISAVCTAPEARGQGLGARAVAAIAGLIRAEGTGPFLHVFADNAPAIALYEKLGFTLRRELRLTVLRRADWTPPSDHHPAIARAQASLVVVLVSTAQSYAMPRSTLVACNAAMPRTRSPRAASRAAATAGAQRTPTPSTGSARATLDLPELEPPLRTMTRGRNGQRATSPPAGSNARPAHASRTRPGPSP